MQGWRSFLGDVDFSDFFDSFWGFEALVSSNCVGLPDLSERDFLNLIAEGKIDPDNIEMFSDEGRVDGPEIGWPAFASTCQIDEKVFASPVTIRVSNLDRHHDAIGTFALNCRDFFSCDIHINSYLTLGEAQGLAAHYDPHHLFAIQMAGQKTWELGPIVVDTPDQDFIPALLQEPNLDSKFTLMRHMVLYLPPGKWHRASTSSSSLHITVGLHPPKFKTSLIRAVESVSRSHPILRAPMPLTATQDGLDFYTDIDDLSLGFQLVADELSALNDDDLLFSSLPKNVQMSIGDDPAIHLLLDEIWDFYSSPYALYLRGSYAKDVRNFEPWDIDVYLIVDGLAPSTDDVRIFCKEAADRHPHVPRLDLSVFERNDFMNSENRLMNRVLITTEGRLHRGHSLDGDFEIPSWGPELSARLRLPMQNFLKQILIEMNWDGQAVEKLSTMHFELYTKSVAKSLLRAGLLFGLSFKKTFSRDILQCQSWLIEQFPEASFQIGMMMGRVQGESFGLREFIDASEFLYKHIYQSNLTKLENNKSDIELAK